MIGADSDELRGTGYVLRPTAACAGRMHPVRCGECPHTDMTHDYLHARPNLHPWALQFGDKEPIAAGHDVCLCQVSTEAVFWPGFELP